MEPQQSQPSESLQWQYNPAGGEPNESANTPQGTTATLPSTLSWTAVEAVQEGRNAGWFVSLFAGSLLVAVVVYLISKSYFSAAMLPVIAIIVAIFASRKPQEVHYELAQGRISVNGKEYPLGDFRSFALMQEPTGVSAILQPIHRFTLPISLYFPAEQADQIIQAMGGYLPMQQAKLDFIEKLARRLRL